MVFVGIDVASQKHDCCILSEKMEVLTAFTFANDKLGFEKLLGEISRFCALEDAKIGLESTGHYSLNLQNYLSQKRLSVTIFNPLFVNLQRKAKSLRKTKTDQSDARFLAELLVAEGSKPYQPTVSAVSELRIHTRNRFRMVQARSKLKLQISRLVTILFPEFSSTVWSVNQKSSYALLLEFPTARNIANAHLTRLSNILSENSHGRYGREKAIQIREAARNSIGFDSRATGFELQQIIRQIQFLQEQIDAVDKEIKTIMREIDTPILSIPGIGFTLGAIIVSEIGNVENFDNSSKLLAFAGLDPSTYQSGNYTAAKTPMVKRGSAYLRWALLQAARLVAYRDVTFSFYYEKKRSQGKHHFVALTHTAKKLVRVVFHLLKTGQNFAPQAG
jgi:transposase